MSALEEDRDFLLRSLEDLDREREAGDLDESDYVALKEDYTARAAAVLRALASEPEAANPAGPEPEAANPAGRQTANRAEPETANPSEPKAADPTRPEAANAAEPGPAGPGARARLEHGHRPVAAGAPAAGPQARRRLTERAPAGGGPGRWRPVVVGAVLLAFASAAGLLVARSAGERLPGDPATGEIAATGPSSENADELAVARDLIGEGRTLDAIKAYDRVLERDPEQPEALAYRGWLLRLAGKAAGDTSLVDKGMEFIERAVAADPGYPDARFFRAFVNYQDRRDPAAAVPDLRAYLAGESPPEMRPVVEDLLRRALADAERGVTSPEPVPAPPTTTAPG